MFARDVVSSDWNRYVQYMVRIRRLCENGRRTTVEIDTSVYARLAYHHGIPILPKLHTFELTEYATSKLPLNQLHLFIGPKITHITTPLSSSPSDFILFTGWLRGASPQLSTLNLSLWSRGKLDPSLSNALCTDLSEILLCQHHLSTFDGGSIALHDRAIMHLAGLSTLRHMILHNDANDLVRCHSLGEMRHSFTNLALVSFRTSSLAPVAAIIRMSKPPLEDITIHITSSTLPSSAEIKEFFDSLKPTTIKYIEIDRENTSNTSGGNAVVRLIEETFASTRAFSSLHSLNLRLPLKLLLGDTALTKIVKSWPRLESLILGPSPVRPGDNADLTFAALRAIAKYCPDLSYLSITLRGNLSTMMEDTDTESRPGAGITCENEIFFDFGASTFVVGSEEADLALYLSDLFPHIESLEAWTHASEGDAAAMKWKSDWENVWKIIGPVCQARRQERSWCES